MDMSLEISKTVDGLVGMVIATLENKMSPAQLEALTVHKMEMIPVADSIAKELSERIMSLVETIADRVIDEFNMILTPKAHLRSDHFMGIIGDCPRPHIER